APSSPPGSPPASSTRSSRRDRSSATSSKKPNKSSSPASSSPPWRNRRRKRSVVARSSYENLRTSGKQPLRKPEPKLRPSASRHRVPLILRSRRNERSHHASPATC